jgi:uncharacterized YigZ family protein
MTHFLTLAASGNAETRIKASVFLAHAAPAASAEEARSVIEAWSRPYFDATHHCTAWRLHDGTWRVNDDGEPSGSAGLPILAALDGADVVDCVVIVTRYYGGTKLGVGGLVRAYGEAAALALEAAPRKRGILALRLRVTYPYELTSPVMRVLEQVGARAVEHGFDAEGAGGVVEFSVPREEEPRVGEMLTEWTAAAVAPEVIGEEVLYEDAPNS